MAPKRPAPTASDSISASDSSDAEPDSAINPDAISPSPTKTPTAPPNPTSDPANSILIPLADPDDVDLGSDSADSESESEPDHDHTPNSKPTPSPPKPDHRPYPPISDSDNPEPEFDNYRAFSDSDHHDGPPPPPPQRPSRADPSAIKPISSRPMDTVTVAANTGGGYGSSLPSRPVTEPQAKRPRSSTVAATSISEKRPQRLWSPEDELAILSGLVVYRAEHGGTLPGSSHDIATLYTCIRSTLSVKVSTTQLSDKVRRLKQKYQLFATRAKNGKDPEFPVPHDKSIYDIAKTVWAAGYESNNNVGSGVESDEEESDEMESGRDYDNDNNNKSNVGSRNRKGRRMRATIMANGGGGGSRNVVAEEKGKEMFPYLWEAVEELVKEQPNGVVFKRAFEVLERSKARAMEEKLRRFRMVEIRQQLRRIELMRETVKVVLEALEWGN